VAAASGSEEIPEPAGYYEIRNDYFNQGDIFRGVTLVSPLNAGEIAEDVGGKFFPGPVGGLCMLITPSCCMQAQGEQPGAYAHPVRAVVPVVGLQALLDGGWVKKDAAPQLRRYDNLKNYMYLPPNVDFELEESVALLWMPMSLHHDQVDGLRVAQLANEAARQLQRKLQWFYTGVMDPRGDFEPELG
jgi:hypothetical protein